MMYETRIEYTSQRKISDDLEDFSRFSCYAIGKYIEAKVCWTCETFKPYFVEVVAKDPEAEDWQVQKELNRIKRHSFFKYI